MLETQSEILLNEIDQKESELADKLETLEQKVLDVVQETTNTVQETVEVAKETVDHTVEAVQSTMGTLKETFDLRKQVAEHPWSLMAASAAAGFVLFHVTHAAGTTVHSRRQTTEDDSASGIPSRPPRQTSLRVFESVMTQSLVPVFQGLLAGLCGEFVHVFAKRPASPASMDSDLLSRAAHGTTAMREDWQHQENGSPSSRSTSRF